MINITPTFFPFNQTQMIEVSLFGIVLGLILLLWLDYL